MLSCTLCSCCSGSRSPAAAATPSSNPQFFETINPLNGFGGKESLETYMWEQSLKLEPKDPDKMEFTKPSRPSHVLKSPGIKPPKGISSAPSTSGPSNHYSGFRASGRGFSSLNNYSPSVSHSPDTPRPNFLSNSEDRNSHLGMVEIIPGQQPRYLGDAKRGAQSTVNLPTEPRAPAIMPRTKHRSDKASSTPPSPQTSQNLNDDSTADPPPPPLYPRKMSPQAPPPPLKVSTHVSSAASGPVPPHSAPFCCPHFERPDLFVFPPHDANAMCSVADRANFPTTASVPESTVPVVPPRKKAEQLPSPLSDDTLRIVWNEETNQVTPVADTAVTCLPSSCSDWSTNDRSTPPRLYPRRIYPVEPPPRPPKTFHINKSQDLADVKGAQIGRTECDSPPPPLPPKTYKRRQQFHRPLKN